MSKKRFSGKGLTFRFMVLLGLILSNPGLMVPFSADAQQGEHLHKGRSFDAVERVCDGCRPLFTSSPPQNTGPVLVVTNTNMEENGACCGPFALIADPGPDGISFAEAMHAVSDYSDLHETITFDPSLSGSIIDTTQGFLSAILADGLTIDGDLDDDGDPDITLDGQGRDGNGIWLWAASHVLVEGLIIRNYGWGGIRITNNVEVSDLNVFEDIVIRNNKISGIGYKGAIDIVLENVDSGVIRDIEIVGNTILDDSLGVNIEAGWGGNLYNEISHVSIISNTITGGISIRAAGGFHSGTSHHTVSDMVIRGNQISGMAILLDAANRSKCNDNTIRDVVISDNQIDVSPIAIEIVTVGESGWDSHDNLVKNITLTDNMLTGGGIQIGGATAGNSYNNTMSGIVIDRNQITSCAANGIYLIAGDNGAHHNLIENSLIRNSLVAFCSGAGVLLHGDDSSSANNTINEVKLANLTLVNNGIGTPWAGGLNINSLYPGNIISGVTISNTILWENSFEDAILGSLAPDSVAYSILNDVRFTGSDGNLYQSPEFVDPTSWDYSLQASSPGVDTGDPSALNIGPLDLDKNMRLWDGDGDMIAIVDRGAWEYDAIQPQEIGVEGNQFSIFNGDIVPGYWDGTDFGIARISGETIAHTFTLRNTGSLALNLIGDPKVTMNGIHAADFSVTVQPQSPVAASGSTTFTIAFSPSVNGPRHAIVSIANDDGDENPYTFAIQGTGISEGFKIYLPFVLR
jgi:hypothetical protein